MPETIGQQLKQARLARNLSLDEVVRATRIRANAITALEADDFESLSSPTQARGFLKIYAAYLGLSLEELYARQRGDAPAETPIPAAEAGASSPEDGGKPKKAAGSKPTPRRRKTTIQPAEPDTTAAPLPPSMPDLPAERLPAKVAQAPGATEPVPAPAGSQVLFDAIGSRLRQQRENLSLSLDEIERHTHVRRRHLELLEAGEFAQLPSSVQARGMLQNYSRFLNMDVDALLLKFADGLQALLAERQPKPEVEAGRQKRPAFRFALPPALRRVLTPDLLVGGGVLLLLVLFAIWGTTRIVQQNAAVTPQPTAPSISNILLSTPVPGESTPTGTPAAGTAPPATSSAPTLEIKLPPAGEGPVQVVLVAVRSAWVKVLVDFEVAFEGRATPGTAYAFDAETQIEVISGDGSALSIIYNQSDMGAMGAYGELVDRIYTATTILIPTATFTPTASVTPTPTRTLRPSATTRPTNTQVPPATLVP